MVTRSNEGVWGTGSRGEPLLGCEETVQVKVGACGVLPADERGRERAVCESRAFGWSRGDVHEKSCLNCDP